MAVRSERYEEIIGQLKKGALADPKAQRRNLILAVVVTLAVFGLVFWGVGALLGWIVGVVGFVVVGGGYLWNSVNVYREVFESEEVLRRVDVEKVAKRWRL